MDKGKAPSEASGLSENEVMRRLVALLEDVEIAEPPAAEPETCARQLCVPEGRFSDERLAVDVFRYLFTVTKLDPMFHPETDLEDNDYRYGEDTIHYLCYPALLHVIGHRRYYFLMHLQGESAVQAIDQPVEICAKHLKIMLGLLTQVLKVRTISMQRRFHISLAFSVEWAHFLVKYKQGNLVELLAKIPKFWLRYFNDNLRKFCEDHKILERTVVFGREPLFPERLLVKFFEEHGIPYRKKALIETVVDFLVKEKRKDKELLPEIRVEGEDDYEPEQRDDLFNRLGFIPHEVLQKEIDEGKTPKKPPTAAAAAACEPPSGPTNKEKIKEKLKSLKAIRTGQERREVPEIPLPRPVKEREFTLLELEVMATFMRELDFACDSGLLVGRQPSQENPAGESTPAQGAIPKKREGEQHRRQK